MTDQERDGGALSSISSAALIGAGVQIGKFCIVEDGAVLSDGVKLGDFVIIRQGARIGANTKIGDYCKVGAGASVGSDCSFTAYCEVRDECVVGERVSMGSRCTLSAGTVVEDDVTIKYAFVATDTPNLHENDQKSTCKLRSGSLFGANVTIMPGVTVGRNSQIGASSQVRHDVPDEEIWFGTPAKFFKRST